MKLRDLKQGDKFQYAAYPNGAPYVWGGKISGYVDTYWVFSTIIGYVYMGDGDDEVIKVGNINE